MKSEGQSGTDDPVVFAAQAAFAVRIKDSNDVSENFALYNRDAAALAPGQTRLVAIDWWNGNRVPYADKGLRGLMAGLALSTTAADIYRALMDSICFGRDRSSTCSGRVVFQSTASS